MNTASLDRTRSYSSKLKSVVLNCFDSKLYIFWLLTLLVVVLLHLNGNSTEYLYHLEHKGEGNQPRVGELPKWLKNRKLLQDNANHNFTVDICNGTQREVPKRHFKSIPKCSLACLGSVRTFYTGSTPKACSELRIKMVTLKNVQIKLPVKIITTYIASKVL